MVLTFDDRTRQNLTLREQYRDIVYKWDKLRKRLTRYYGKFSYITVVEQHKDGVPHCNILLYSPVLYHRLSDDGWRREKKEFLDSAIIESGFGYQYRVDQLKSKNSVSGYLVKLLRRVDQSQDSTIQGEMVKGCQIPYAAPKHFRRLRSSKGMIRPLREDNPEWTGELHQTPIDYFLTEEQEILLQSQASKAVLSSQNRPINRINWEEKKGSIFRDTLYNTDSDIIKKAFDPTYVEFFYDS